MLFLVPLFAAAGFLRISQEGQGVPSEAVPSEKQTCAAVGAVEQAYMGTDGCRLLVRTQTVQTAGVRRQQELLVLVYAEGEAPCPGSRVALSGQILPLSKADNPGQFDEYEYYRAQGICAKLYADSIRVLSEGRGLRRGFWLLKRKLSEVFHSVLPEEQAGVLDAMLLAEKGMLSDGVKELYRDSGLSHTLVVSGLHLSMLGLGFYRLLRRLRLGANASMAAAGGMVLCFCGFAGTGIPVVRAAVMLLMSLFSGMFGKTYDAPTGLAAAALLVLLGQPLQLFQAGFLLSFGAVAGILIFQPLFERMGLARIGSSLSVQLVLTPVTLWFFYELPVYSVFLNLVILPFLSLLLMLGLLTGAGGILYPGIGRFFAGGVNAILNGYEAVCRLNESLPGRRLCFGRPQIWQLALYLILTAVFYLLCRKYEKKRCLGFLLLFGVFLLPGRGRWQAAFLSVGQGDCAVLQSGKLTVLVDAGSSIRGASGRILVPYLKYLGDDTIEYAFVSHADSDHYSMLEELLQEMAEGKSKITVQTLILPEAGMGEESAEKLALLAGQAGVEVITFSAGDRLTGEQLELVCLYPRESLGPGRHDRNDTSLALRVRLPGAEFLFAGDLPASAEQEVLEILKACGDREVRELPKTSGERKDESAAQDSGIARYLKSAHHGSRYSNSEELLAYFTGCRAIISCGKNNRYGHPHAETLERMERWGVESRITWQTGAVLVSEKGLTCFTAE